MVGSGSDQPGAASAAAVIGTVTATGPLAALSLADGIRSDASGSAYPVGLFDDRHLADGCGYGPALGPRLDFAIS